METALARKSSWGTLGGVAVVACLAGLAAGALWPALRARLPGFAHAESSSNGSAPHEHAGHHHAHGPERPTIEVTAQGLKNIGFRPYEVRKQDYQRFVTLPAVVVERPGRSQMQIVAPCTGVVSVVHRIEGEAIPELCPLFDLRITHEDLVASQRDLLRLVEELDVVLRELKRLEAIDQGVIAGKAVLEVRYQQQKLQAAIKAEKQGLVLHGLSEEQVAAIVDTRKLLPSLTISAPPHGNEGESCQDDHLFHIQKLLVQPGQQVEKGETLCVLADHCELFLEGSAFEEEAEGLRRAAAESWELSATLARGKDDPLTVAGLKVFFIADQVDRDSRAFRFYVQLPNDVALTKEQPGDQKFILWQFRPGQRMELRVPVDRWQDRIVLPVDAVVEDGVESYVFRQNGDRFERVAVHVEHKDQESAVIAGDGSLFPGDIVAGRGAYQLSLALKNQSGGAPDPHAGHTH